MGISAPKGTEEGPRLGVGAMVEAFFVGIVWAIIIALVFSPVLLVLGVLIRPSIHAATPWLIIYGLLCLIWGMRSSYREAGKPPQPKAPKVYQFTVVCQGHDGIWRELPYRKTTTRTLKDRDRKELGLRMQHHIEEQPWCARVLECPRGRGHLIAWVCPTRLEGCGVHAKDASAVSRGVPS